MTPAHPFPTRATLLLAVAACFAADFLRAQVPQLLHYQGQVAVNGNAFEGAGSFRFALVDAAGTTSYWSNDGSSAGGGQPADAVVLEVSGGAYSVLLGDATLPNMRVLPATVFTNDEVFLRVWFDDGVHGVQLLSPDQRIVAVGYAMMAANVPANSITSEKLANGAVTSEKIAPGAVGAQALDPEVLAGGVAGDDGVVLTKSPSSELASAGYVKLGAFQTDDAWEGLPRGTLEGAGYRRDHTAVWTGTEMLVWGGRGDPFINGGQLSETGSRYDPVANTWTAMSEENAPAPRRDHTVVWTGSEMIVWGGVPAGGSGAFGDGARYNPATDTWTPISSLNAPSARHLHTAVWTGSEMIVWGGGEYFGAPTNTGARYDPSSDTWTPLSTSGAPTARFRQSAVWTGSEMIVWGGYHLSTAASGGRYNPGTDAWKPVRSGESPRGRELHTAVWTGTELIVWGGASPFSESGYFNDGGRYNPATGTWREMSTVDAPMARTDHTAVWTGSEMIIWGGRNGSSYLNSGARYDPGTDTWQPTNTGRTAPPGRGFHAAVWTGEEMIVWGGNNPLGGGASNVGGRYHPDTDTWSAMTTDVAPVGSVTAVWTGSEGIVWGGGSGSAPNTGARYDPVLDAWSPISQAGSPEPRTLHTAVWTGEKMLIWGGLGGGIARLNTGGLYDPVEDEWDEITTANAPDGRVFHTAVWTGREMVVWGGNPGQGLNPLRSGGRYDPQEDFWRPVREQLAPSPREKHTAVWTGSRMIVFSGTYSGGNFPFNGGIYDSGSILHVYCPP